MVTSLPFHFYFPYPTPIYRRGFQSVPSSLTHSEEISFISSTQVYGTRESAPQLSIQKSFSKVDVPSGSENFHETEHILPGISLELFTSSTVKAITLIS